MIRLYKPTLVLGLIFTHLVSVIGPQAPAAQAADTTTTTTNPAGITGYTPFSPTTVPANFQIAQASSLSNLYGSCFSVGKDQTDPLVSSIVQLTTGKDKSSKGGDTSCSKVNANSCQTAFSANGVSCPADASASAIDTLFNKLIGKAGEADCCVKGKIGQLQEASKELNCISQQNDLLANQVKSLQTTFQDNLQKAQKDLAQIDGVVTDRANQMQFVQSKLGGDKENGNGGLLKLQGDLQKVVTGQLPTAVKAFQDQITAFNQQQVIFQQRVQNQKMALAAECFNSPDARYQCSVNSTSTCSFKELIEAKYYELSRSINGQIQRDNTSNQAQAQSKKAALDALMSSIFSNMASDPKLGATTQQELQAQQQKAGDIYRVQTPQDLEALYGQQLTQYNIPGLDVHQLFVNKFQQCYTDATATVTTSMSNSTSQYSLSVAAMEKQKQDIRDGFTQFYKGYGEMYTQFWSTMGQTAPLDTTKCQDPSTPLAGMMKCAKDLATNLDGAYTGTTPNSMVSVLVKGTSTNPITQFSFNCYGVNGCVTTMQNLQTNLKSEMQNLDTFKKGYINQANQSIEQWKSQMQQVLSVQSQQLAGRLATLRGTLSKNGVQDPLTPQYMQKEPLKKGAAWKDSSGGQNDGLYDMPGNLLAAIGADLTPPLIDPAAGSFDNARAGIAQALSGDQAKEGELADVIGSLQKAKDACQAKKVQDGVQKASQQIGALVGSCATSDEWCSTGKGASALSELYNNLSQVAMGQDTFDSIEGTLNTGIQKCKDSVGNLDRAKEELSKATATVNECKNTLKPDQNLYQICALPLQELKVATNEKDKAQQAARTPATCSKLTGNVQNAVKSVVDNGGGTTDAAAAQ